MMSSFLLPVQVITGVELAKNRIKNRRLLARPIFPRYAQHALVIAIATIMAGCSSTPVQTNNHKLHGKKSHSSNAQNVGDLNDLDLESADSLEELLQATDMEAVEGDRLAVLRYGNLWKRILVGFRMDLSVNNSRIDAQRNWFVSRQPYIDRLSARASRYIYYTVTEAERRGIPTELALLPVIESSYDPFANSGASAAGMWQFIPSTGREYGLRQNQYYDGRRDVVESTRAAYDFLTNLYKQFGSWELALAAYNAGGGRIQQAINRNIAQGLPTDYWSLRLPTETMNYVPRFLAVAQIIKNPQNYGVKLPNIANRSHFRQVTMSGPVDLDQVVRTTGLSSKDILELNPAFLQGITPPSGPHRVLIPTSLPITIDSRLKAIQIVDPNRFGYSNESGLLAMSQPITQTITKTVTRTSTPVILSTSQAASIMSSGTRTNSSNVTESITVRNNQRIPKDSESLAAMANQAVVPSNAQISNVVQNVERPVTNSQKITTTTTSVSQPVTTKTNASTMTVTTRPVTSNLTTRALTANSATSVNPATITNTTTTSTTTNTLVSIPLLTQSPIVVAPAQSPNITPIIAMSIDKKSDRNSTAIVDPLDGKIALTTLQPQQTVVETKTEIKVSSVEIKKPIASDIKTNKLIPEETKVIAQVKKPEKPKGIRTVYIVKTGDTLSNVANKAGLSWRDIAKWNQMDTNANLITGTPLYLYGAKKVVEAAPTSYVVQAGDNLTDVAAQFNLTPRQLADRNDLKVTSYLITGARLNLIENTDSAASQNNQSKNTNTKATDKSNDPVAAKTDDYTIQRGDTLAKVAARYNLSVSALAKLNEIPVNTSLHKGDTLNVPAIDQSSKKLSTKAEKQATESDSIAKVNTTDYKVKSGETLSRIAARYHLTLSALADLNGISAQTRIQAGDTINVPSEEKVSKKPNAKDDNQSVKSETSDQPNRTDYKVKSGETLARIAARHGLTVVALADLNGIPSNTRIQTGDTISVPQADKPTKKKGRG